MKRQGLITTIEELEKIIKGLKDESKGVYKQNRKGFKKIKWQLNIINKENLSDTWKFEK